MLNNANKIIEILGISYDIIVMSGPYFQRASKRNQGCQIDLLIQTKHDTVYICEIKFSRKEITKAIIPEVALKCSNLNVPKHISKCPVLIHVNGVNDNVLDEGYFVKVIDFGDLFL